MCWCKQLIIKTFNLLDQSPQWTSSVCPGPAHSRWVWCLPVISACLPAKIKKPGHENLDLLNSNGPHCPLVAALRYSEQIIPLGVGTGRGHTFYHRRIRTRTHHADHRFKKFLPRNVHPCHFYGARIPRRTWSQEVLDNGPGVVPQWPADLKMAWMTK